MEKVESEASIFDLDLADNEGIGSAEAKQPQEVWTMLSNKKKSKVAPKKRCRSIGLDVRLESCNERNPLLAT